MLMNFIRLLIKVSLNRSYFGFECFESPCSYVEGIFDNKNNKQFQGPFKFLKNFKSPCWKPAEKSSWEPPIRCLPYFYLIGAPKSGTTDMHRRLIKHPEISKLVVKEPHWLTRRHYCK
jgi:hypothetical protein